MDIHTDTDTDADTGTDTHTDTDTDTETDTVSAHLHDFVAGVGGERQRVRDDNLLVRPDSLQSERV